MMQFLGYEEFSNREEHENKLKELGLKKEGKFEIMQLYFKDKLMDEYYKHANHY